MIDRADIAGRSQSTEDQDQFRSAARPLPANEAVEGIRHFITNINPPQITYIKYYNTIWLVTNSCDVMNSGIGEFLLTLVEQLNILDQEAKYFKAV